MCKWVVSDSSASSWGSFLFLLAWLVQLWHDGSCFHLTRFYFVTFYCHLLETCSFLMRDRKRVDPDARQGEQLRGRGNWSQYTLYEKKKLRLIWGSGGSMKQKHSYVYFESYLEYKTLKISSLCVTQSSYI